MPLNTSSGRSNSGLAKPSALGIEEQRLYILIRIGDDLETFERRRSHGYRFKEQIIWEKANVLTVSSSVLLREQGDWAVFSVKEGNARLNKIAAKRNNGVLARINSELEAGEHIFVFPTPGLVDSLQV